MPVEKHGVPQYKLNGKTVTGVRGGCELWMPVVRADDRL